MHLVGMRLLHPVFAGLQSNMWTAAGPQDGESWCLQGKQIWFQMHIQYSSCTVCGTLPKQQDIHWCSPGAVLEYGTLSLALKGIETQCGNKSVQVGRFGHTVKVLGVLGMVGCATATSTVLHAPRPPSLLST